MESVAEPQAESTVESAAEFQAEPAVGPTVESTVKPTMNPTTKATKAYAVQPVEDSPVLPKLDRGSESAYEPVPVPEAVKAPAVAGATAASTGAVSQTTG